MKQIQRNILWLHIREQLPVYLIIGVAFAIILFYLSRWGMVLDLRRGTETACPVSYVWTRIKVMISVMVVVLGAYSLAGDREKGYFTFLLQLPVRRELLLLSRWIPDVIFIYVIAILFVFASPLPRIIAGKQALNMESYLITRYGILAILLTMMLALYFLSSLMSLLLDRSLSAVLAALVAYFIVRLLITLLVDGQPTSAPFSMQMYIISRLGIAVICIYISVNLLKRMKC